MDSSKQTNHSSEPQIVHSYTLSHTKKIQLIPAVVEERTSIVICPQGFYLLPQAMTPTIQTAQVAPAPVNETIIITPSTIIPTSSTVNENTPLDLSNRNISFTTTSSTIDTSAPVVNMVPMITTPLITTMAPTIPHTMTSFRPNPILSTPTSNSYHMMPYRVMQFRPTARAATSCSTPRFALPSSPALLHVSPLTSTPLHVSLASPATSLQSQTPFTYAYQDSVNPPTSNEKRKSNESDYETRKMRSKAKKR